MREGWSYKKLGEVCEIRGGATPLRTNDAFWTNGNIPWFTIDDIREQGKYITFTNQKITEAAKEKLFTFPTGTIMLCCTASLGACSIAKIELTSNQQFNGLMIKNREELLEEYLYYFATTLTPILLSLSGKATINFVSRAKVEKIEIPIPPLATQQQIVSELDLLSHILDQKRQQLKEYDALAESIFYDMFGDPVENPKGWEVKKLESLVSINSKLVDPKIAPYCEMYHVGPANIISGTGEIVDVKKAKEETLISGKYIFEEGMILYSKIRPALNKVALAYMHGLCSADMYPLSPNIEIVNAFFLKYVLSGPAFLKYAIEQSGRARMPKINREALFAFEFPLPPLSLQRSFATKIESIEHQKQLLRASIKETEMLFQSRMDYWFNS